MEALYVLVLILWGVFMLVGITALCCVAFCVYRHYAPTPISDKPPDEDKMMRQLQEMMQYNPLGGDADE